MRQQWNAVACNKVFDSKVLKLTCFSTDAQAELKFAIFTQCRDRASDQDGNTMQAASEQMECELCKRRRSPSTSSPAASRRKLRILCLHGFRQNGETFKAKLAKLTEATKDIADYVFLDAPHTLAFLYRPRNDPGTLYLTLPASSSILLVSQRKLSIH